jgi:hypothetical protein
MPRLLKVNAKIGIPLFNKGNNLIDIVCGILLIGFMVRVVAGGSSFILEFVLRN